MKSSLTTSPLIRLLLRGIWCIALVAAPFSMPGLAPTGDGLEWVAPLYGALAAACVYLSTPLMGLAMLAGIDLYHVANLAGHGPQLTLYASLAAVALLLAWRDLLLAPPAPWLPAGLRAALRPAMLPLTLLASLPLYFQLCAPWPSLLLAPWCLLLWASMPRRRALLTELLAACAGAALALTLFGLVSEAGARMLFAPHPPNHLLRPHPTRIVDLVPNAYGVFSFQEFQCPPFRAAISAQGIRDRYFGPKPAGVRRVLAIGDSTTFGWGVALEETLPRQLEAVLQQREGAAAVEVINAGTPTYGPWQTLDWLKERGADFEPDAVLFTLFPVNDPGNELYRAGRQLKCYTPEAIAATRRYERALFWPERIDRWLHLHSRFYQLAIHAHPQRQHHVLTALSQLRAMQGDLFPPLPPPEPGEPTMELNRKLWYPDLHEAVNMVMQSIRAMHQHCREQGWDFYVLVLPSQVCVLQPAYEGAARQCPFDVVDFTEGKECRIFMERLTTEGIAAACPREAMATTPDPSIYHLPNDGHLSPLGNQLAAETAATLL